MSVIGFRINTESMYSSFDFTWYLVWTKTSDDLGSLNVWCNILIGMVKVASWCVCRYDVHEVNEVLRSNDFCLCYLTFHHVDWHLVKWNTSLMYGLHICCGLFHHQLFYLNNVVILFKIALFGAVRHHILFGLTSGYNLNTFIMFQKCS